MTPMTAASPPELHLENQLCFSLYAATHAFAQAYRPHLEPMGLTYPQYLVMLRLWEEDDQSVKALGQPLFLDSGTLTPLLKRMETAGLIVRRRDLKDERVVRVRLTPKGRALQAQAKAIPAAMLCATGLDLPNLIHLREELKTVGARLRKA